MRQKDLILLPFPFSDLESNKVRPALIISNDKYNKYSSDILAVPLTSIIKEMPYSLIIEQKDLSKGKLLKTSRVKVDKVFAVEKKKILMEIGSLKDGTFRIIRGELLKLF